MTQSMCPFGPATKPSRDTCMSQTTFLVLIPSRFQILFQYLPLDNLNNCAQGSWSRPRRAGGSKKPGWSRCGLLHWSFLMSLDFVHPFQEFIETLVGFIHSFFSTALDHSVPVGD